MGTIKRWWLRLLRDFFAGCALIGEMNDTALEGVSCPPETEALLAYQVADAMLRERGK